MGPAGLRSRFIPSDSAWASPVRSTSLQSPLFPEKRREIPASRGQGTKPQTAPRTCVGSPVPAAPLLLPVMPQSAPILGHTAPPSRPRSVSDAPRYPPGASSSACWTPGPCCGRSRSSGRTTRRAWGQSRGAAELPPSHTARGGSQQLLPAPYWGWGWELGC